MSAKHAASSKEESSDDEGGQHPGGPATAGGRRVDNATLELLKRDKRLAMNRESARARRRRKKIRLETLEQRAEDLCQTHNKLVLTNQTLKARVTHLETELASATGGRATIGLGGAMDPSSMLGGSTRVGGENWGLRLAGGQRASFSLQQQELAGTGGAGIGSSAFGAGTGMGTTGLDPDMHYLQMQHLQMQHQLLSSQLSGGAGAGGLAAMRGGIGGGQMSDMNLQLPGLRRLDELSRMRGAEALQGPTTMDMALSPADAAARLRGQSNASKGTNGQRRELKSELFDSLSDINKKFPP